MSGCWNSRDRNAGTNLPTPTHQRNICLIGHCDQGGRPDAVQVMVHRDYAYIGHIFSSGCSVIDLRNRKHPVPVTYIPAPPNTWCLHLQTHDDLLLVIHNKNMFTQADEKAYDKGKVAQYAAGVQDWSAGMAVYDIKKNAAPRQIGFMPVQGNGSSIPAAGGRMPRPCWTVSRITFSLPLTWPIRPSPKWLGNSGSLA